MFNAARTGKTPPLPASETARLGFDIVLFPIEPLLAAFPVMREIMDVVRREGTPKPMANRLASFSDINAVVGLSEYYALERQFSTPNS